MIFYFSGTGNSKWVAEEVSKQLNEELINIANVPKDKTFSFNSDQVIGFVFPIYAWGAPENVVKFVKKVSSNGAYTFAICTCVGEAGYAIMNLSKIVNLSSGYSISMPNNWVTSSKLESKEKIQKKIAQARIKINDICISIKNREDKFDVTVGKIPFIKSNLIYYFFNKFGRNTKPFYVSEGKCTSCGYCEKICPAETIKINAGKPEWSKQCYQCMACINRCPQKAIQYGKGTLNKDRYYFKIENDNN